MLSVHRLSLFTRLLVPFVVVITIAFAVGAWLAIHVGESALDASAMGHLAARARQRFDEVDRFLGDRAGELRSWCVLSVIDDALVHDRTLEIEDFLIERLRERSQWYATLTVLDRAETVIASTDKNAVGSSLSVAALTPYADPGGGTRWSAVPAGPSANPKLLRIAQPIRSRSSTEPIGWLVATVRWDAIERIVAKAADGSPTGDTELDFLLVDDSGKVVVGDRSRADAEGRLGIGDDYLVVTHRAPDGAVAPLRGFGIVAAWDKRAAFSVDRIFVALVLATTVLALVLAAGTSFAIARYMTARLNTLVEGIGQVARGELSHRVEEGPDDEFGALARAFNTMEGELVRARDQLEAAAAGWKAIITHAPDVILTVDRDGKILFINRVVPGLEVDRVIGTNVDRYTPPQHAAALHAAIERVFRSGDPESLEHEAVGPNASAAWYSSRIGPVRRDGAIIGVSIITSDITERKRLEKEVLEIAESERARIGRDLHDGLGQSLTGVALLAKGLEQQLAAKAPEHAEQARRIGALIGDTIGQTQKLAQALYPSVLEERGLRGALEELVVGVEWMYGIRCRIRMADGAAPEDRTRATHLFRIVQEAVNNAVRHGKARQIDILVARNRYRGLLAIRDDGVGFHADAKGSEGMGLRSMRYRAGVLGGKLEIRGKPGGGMIVLCRFA